METQRFMIWTAIVVALRVGGFLWGWVETIEVFGLIILNVYLFVVLALVLGNRNLFFTVVKEGQVKGVVRFGRAHKCIMTFMGHRFRYLVEKTGLTYRDQDWDVINLQEHLKGLQQQPDSKLTLKDIKPQKGLFRKFMKTVFFIDFGGLYLVGLWPFYKVYTYQFKWTSLRGELPPNIEEEEIAGLKYQQARAEMSNHILVRQETYLLVLLGVEDTDLIPVDFKIVWTGKIVNPFKALFRVQEWLETSSNRLLAYLRPRFAESTWKKFHVGDNLLSHYSHLKEITGQIEKLYGWYTVGLEISSLTPPPEFAQAALVVRQAEAEKDAATHKAEAIRIIAKAESGRIATVFGAAKHVGDEGVAMKITEDLSKGANTTVIIPGAGSLLDTIKTLVKGR